MVPKPQYQNVLGRQKSLACGVKRQLVRPTVVETIQFHRQTRRWTIDIQKELFRWMLAAELEPGESPCSQSLPKLPFFLRLFAAELSGALGWVHPESIE